jgi:sialidase-1
MNLMDGPTAVPHVSKTGVLYRERRFHAAFPSIARFSDGNLVLGFRRARDAKWLLPADKREGLDPLARMDHIDSRSHVVLMELDASGEPVPGAPDAMDMLPFDPEASDQDASLLVTPDDAVVVSSFSYYPLPAEVDAHMQARSETTDLKTGCRYLHWGCHVSLRGRRAGDWRFHHSYLAPDGGYGHHLGVEYRQPVVGAARGQAVRHDGLLLQPVYWGAAQGAAVFASEDLGRTWRFHATVARDPEAKISYQEPALCPTADGGLVCFMRTAGADGRLATSTSVDGLTWSAPTLHALVGHPFHALPLADGRVLLSYGFRDEPFGIRARLLPHAAADPDRSPELVIREDGLCPDLGYPWAVQLADGSIMVVYYWTDAQGIRGIEASWLAA